MDPRAGGFLTARDPAVFAGAPLDAIKCAAALLMVGDHVDTILLDGHAVVLWRLGRIAFPLFCLVLALHLARGADPGRYGLALLVLAVPTQAVYAAAFPYGTTEGSILFTLATGAALAAFLDRAGAMLRHLTFAAGLTVVVAAPNLARTAVDFGLAGILLPPALLLTLRDPPVYVPWLAAVVVGLNWHGWHPRGETAWVSALTDAGTILVCVPLAALAASGLRGRRRFLPPYALQAFYPGHLAVLVALRALG
ncbi:TraX family protein [uncultured Methylobacterium sp.]|uniref:TraX family protein n=1 Tax=uncultured Methylobacterium sp. TaxID=157278 RepID=UPI0035C97AF8